MLTTRIQCGKVRLRRSPGTLCPSAQCEVMPVRALIMEGRGGGGWNREDVQSTLHLGWSGAEVLFTLLARDACTGASLAAFDLLIVQAQSRGHWLETIRQARSQTPAVIIVVSSSYDENDLIEAIEAGADDYVPLPLNRALFVARTRAALRRAGGIAARAPSIPAQCGRLRIDPERYEACVEGFSLELTTTEFRLLFELTRQSEYVVRKGPLCRAVWGHEGSSEDAVLRKYIQSLRRKLDQAGGDAVGIVTVPGVGYKLISSETVASAALA